MTSKTAVSSLILGVFTCLAIIALFSVAFIEWKHNIHIYTDPWSHYNVFFYVNIILAFCFSIAAITTGAIAADDSAMAICGLWMGLSSFVIAIICVVLGALLVMTIIAVIAAIVVALAGGTACACCCCGK